jgi:hypothetical protein
MPRRPRRIWLYGGQQNMSCCLGRPNTCHNLSLLHAHESDFYPDALDRATNQLNELFAQLNADAPEGQHLALIDTSLGPMLVYAKAIERPADISGYVTAWSDESEIREALGLRPAEASA